MVTSSQYGSFVPTNLIWDVAQIHEVDITSPQFKELLVRLYQNVNNIALILNIKDTGQYQLIENVNGQQYFANPANNSRTTQGASLRQVLRKTFLSGALPSSAGTMNIAHGITITPTTTFTRIYGTANNQSGNAYIPLPYVSVTSTADQIELDVNATDIVITVGADQSAYTVNYITLEYLQS